MDRSRTDPAHPPDTPPRDQAYDSFTQKLLSRQLRPGQFLTQREMVDITGLPLGAIREVVPRLEAEGLLRTMPRRGMQIAPIDLNLIREAFQFRAIIEREAVAILCAQITDAALADLRRSHEAMRDAALAGTLGAEDNARAQRIDWGLHDTIVGATDNSIITAAYAVNAVKIRLIHNERVRIEGRVADAMGEHLCIIAALEARDAAAAADAVTRHIESARRIALNP
ncbi:GntR family transcriptional regulator [Oceaniglobus indicus]|uniref:GntR family transcriptional regulator n=1 Tax=Oceaniglobus indicus TaxID=2047749 RepID=UPI000C17E4B6|nr:GntR family transcriptional regulator [Oceaniglobus indicus]